MMTKRKLKIEELKVQSFVTTLNNTNHLFGGRIDQSGFTGDGQSEPPTQPDQNGCPTNECINDVRTIINSPERPQTDNGSDENSATDIP